MCCLFSSFLFWLHWLQAWNKFYFRNFTSCSGAGRGGLEAGDTQWVAEEVLSAGWGGQEIEVRFPLLPPPCMNRPPHSALGLATCSGWEQCDLSESFLRLGSEEHPATFLTWEHQKSLHYQACCWGSVICASPQPTVGKRHLWLQCFRFTLLPQTVTASHMGLLQWMKIK